MYEQRIREITPLRSSCSVAEMPPCMPHRLDVAEDQRPRTKGGGGVKHNESTPALLLSIKRACTMGYVHRMHGVRAP